MTSSRDMLGRRSHTVFGDAVAAPTLCQEAVLPNKHNEVLTVQVRHHAIPNGLCVACGSFWAPCSVFVVREATQAHSSCTEIQSQGLLQYTRLDTAEKQGESHEFAGNTLNTSVGQRRQGRNSAVRVLRSFFFPFNLAFFKVLVQPSTNAWIGTDATLLPNQTKSIPVRQSINDRHSSYSEQQNPCGSCFALLNNAVGECGSRSLVLLVSCTRWPLLGVL